MYGDSHALSSDIFPSNSNPKEEISVFSKNREQKFPFMESDINPNYTQNTSGLLRYRSAPTSLLTNLAEKNGKLGSRFCSDDEANSMNLLENNDNFAAMNSDLPPQYPRQSVPQMGSFSDCGGYRVGGSMGQPKMGSSLMRQNSSPAGLFSHLTSQNDYAGLRGIGSYKMVDNGNLSPSSSRFKNLMNFSSGMPSSLGTLSRITEIENENEPKVGNSSGETSFFTSGFPFGSWNDSSNYAENFSSGVKQELDDHDPKIFVNMQNGESGNRPHILSHHLSLPKTSSEMSAMEKLLQFQDTVPCKIRAKRGCATHPRSIAERVRRTRISERMRKLQDLVPNMDKQTNTADMLDLAVEYIKSLQKQYKILSDNRAKCKCSASQKVVLNQTH